MAYYPAYPPPSAYPPGTTGTNPWTAGVQKNTAIDLTATPSPPTAAPTPTAPVSVSVSPPSAPTPPAASTSTPAPKLEGRTVMCIGEISVTALILYPIRYLAPSNTASDATPATSTMPATCMVKLRYDASKKRMASVVGTSSTDQTINIASPTTAAGPGEDFGVVDQKAANVLAPLMERGLIRTEAKVVKGSENPSILPLKILLFTPKGNIPTISQHLSGQSLYLEHPCIPYNPADHRDNPPYENPHNPPPGGYRMRNNIGSSAPGRWNHSTTATGTSVEVQRSQVDEVFKSLMSGDDLDQNEAGARLVFPTLAIPLTLVQASTWLHSSILTRKKHSLFCSSAKGSSRLPRAAQPRSGPHVKIPRGVRHGTTLLRKRKPEENLQSAKVPFWPTMYAPDVTQIGREYVLTLRIDGSRQNDQRCFAHCPNAAFCAFLRGRLDAYTSSKASPGRPGRACRPLYRPPLPPPTRNHPELARPPRYKIPTRTRPNRAQRLKTRNARRA
ncbi:HIRAN domain-containing protein [Rhizoctonia solani AG-1 IA]|uniref:HIRAN domain-containing protein n=1 Tax=Thanatephorus cucumeris (strain AG1-IA) TaxID=983506 RepID=L8WR46_THACA|nr:HIRAN domain-containing protein [Rhizoctonia solani AG-1 IA]